MSVTAIDGTAFPEPATRSQLYALLAAGLRYPSREMFDALRAGDYQSELRECVLQLPYLSALVSASDREAGLLPVLHELVYEEFESRYVASFEAGNPEPPCPPYEGIYRGGERTQFMLRVSSFYKHFGLAMNRDEGRREVPDHISAELEFMHFLAFKETQACDEDTADLLAGYRLAQKDFLQQQLSQWLPAFAGKLEEACPLPFYVALGRLASDVVTADLEQIKSGGTDTAGTQAYA